MAKGKKIKAVKHSNPSVKQSTRAAAPISTPRSFASKPIEELTERLRHRKLRAPRLPAPPAQSCKRKRSEGSVGGAARTVPQEPWVGDRLLDSLRPLIAHLRHKASPLPSTERQPRSELLAAIAVTDSDNSPIKLLHPTANDIGFGKYPTLENSTTSRLSDSDLLFLAAALRSHRLALFEEFRYHHHTQLWRTQKRCQAPEPDIHSHHRASDSENLGREVSAQRGTVHGPSQPARGIHNVFRAHTQAHITIFRKLRYNKMTLAEFESAVAESEAQVRAENGLPPMLSATPRPQVKDEPQMQEQRTADQGSSMLESTSEGGGIKLPKEKMASGFERSLDRRDRDSGQKTTEPEDAANVNVISVAVTNSSTIESNPKKARRRQQKKAERKEAQGLRQPRGHVPQHPQAAAVVARNVEQQPRTDCSVNRIPREAIKILPQQKSMKPCEPAGDTKQQQELESQDCPLSSQGRKPLSRRERREATRSNQHQPVNAAIIDLTEDSSWEASAPKNHGSNHVRDRQSTFRQTRTDPTGKEPGISDQRDLATGSHGWPKRSSASAGALPPVHSEFPDVASLDLSRHFYAQYSSLSLAQSRGYGQSYDQSSYIASGSCVPYPQHPDYTRHGRLPAVPSHYNPAFGFPNGAQSAPLWAPVISQPPAQHQYHTRSVVKAKSITPSDSERSTPRRSMSPRSRNVAPPREPFPTFAYRQQALQQPKKGASPQPLLIISDLNGTLILRKVKSKTLFIERPALSGFLAHLFARGTASYDWRQHDHGKSPAHKFMIWTSATPQTTTSVTALLLTKEEKSNTVAIWARDKLGLNSRQYNAKVQVYKKMEWVWSDESIQKTHPWHEQGGRWSQRNTLLIDDSVLKATSQPFNLMNVPELTNELMVEEKTTTNVPVLGQVAAYIDEACLYEDVSAWARTNPFVVNGKWSEDKAYNLEKHIALFDANNG